MREPTKIYFIGGNFSVGCEGERVVLAFPDARYAFNPNDALGIAEAIVGYCERIKKGEVQDVAKTQ